MHQRYLYDCFKISPPTLVVSRGEKGVDGSSGDILFIREIFICLLPKKSFPSPSTQKRIECHHIQNRQPGAGTVLTATMQSIKSPLMVLVRRQLLHSSPIAYCTLKWWLGQGTNSQLLATLKITIMLRHIISRLFLTRRLVGLVKSCQRHQGMPRTHSL